MSASEMKANEIKYDDDDEFQLSYFNKQQIII